MLYRLSRKDGRVGYDETIAMVVRAKNAKEARMVAAASATYEGASEWLSPDFSSCTKIHPEGDRQVVLLSFRAG